MRRYLLGWICKLRGYHKATKPLRIASADFAFDGAALSYHLRFVCLCGQSIMRTADIARGGRVTVPVIWGSR